MANNPRQRYVIIKDILVGGSGPDFSTWNYEEIASNNYGGILSVNYGEGIDSDALKKLGIPHAIVPMSSNSPPENEDVSVCLSNLPRAIRFIDLNSINGPVLIHCTFGKDRTGLVSAAYLMHYYQISPEAAIEKISQLRPIAYTAKGWKEFSLMTLEQYSNLLL